MNVIKLSKFDIRLPDFCDECKKLNWVNNNSLEKLNLETVYGNNGAYLGIIENDQIVSIAGYYSFDEYQKGSYRIFYRSATLPWSKTNKGLHKGTGPRGRAYIDKFIELCDSKNLYVTTNVINEKYNKITRYHRALELESKQKNTYLSKVDEIELYNQKQAVWKLDVDLYLERTNNDNV